MHTTQQTVIPAEFQLLRFLVLSGAACVRPSCDLQEEAKRQEDTFNTLQCAHLLADDAGCYCRRQ